MDYVAANPNAGELMVGTGGARRGAPESSGGRSKAAARAEEHASLRLPVAPATGRGGARLPHGHRPGARGGAARALRHRRRKAPGAETHGSQAAGFCGKMMGLGEDLKE